MPKIRDIILQIHHGGETDRSAIKIVVITFVVLLSLAFDWLRSIPLSLSLPDLIIIAVLIFGTSGVFQNWYSTIKRGRDKPHNSNFDGPGTVI